MGSPACHMQPDVIGFVYFTILSTQEHMCWAILHMERSTASGALGSTTCKESAGRNSVMDNTCRQATATRGARYAHPAQQITNAPQLAQHILSYQGCRRDGIAYPSFHQPGPPLHTKL